MADGSIERSVGQWRQQYELLLDQASTLLRNFDANSSDGAVDLVARRQQIIDGFQKFDVDLRGCRPSAGASEQRLLEEFRSFQEAITARIFEIDSLVIALARERMHLLNDELAGLTMRKTAYAAYEGNSTGRLNNGR